MGSGFELLEQWSDWVPLHSAGSNRLVPAHPGLYRIRRIGAGELAYIGQTGGSLRGRLGMLGGVYRVEMPYRDPHTAAPALWALRHRDGCGYEASVVEVGGSVVERKALEAVAITNYRVQSGVSPTFNFGRMPEGYRASSGNNARLVAAGGRQRGGADPTAVLAPPSVPVHGPLLGDPQQRHWMGWDWADWRPVRAARLSDAGTGLYRLRGNSPGLVYVGQGNVASRLRAHLSKVTLPAHRQAEHFAGELEASWVDLPGLHSVQLLEHENDLISAHVLAMGYGPLAQFLG